MLERFNVLPRNTLQIWDDNPHHSRWTQHAIHLAKKRAGSR